MAKNMLPGAKEIIRVTKWMQTDKGFQRYIKEMKITNLEIIGVFITVFLLGLITNLLSSYIFERIRNSKDLLVILLIIFVFIFLLIFFVYHLILSKKYEIRQKFK